MFSSCKMSHLKNQEIETDITFNLVYQKKELKMYIWFVLETKITEREIVS